MLATPPHPSRATGSRTPRIDDSRLQNRRRTSKLQRRKVSPQSLKKKPEHCSLGTCSSGRPRAACENVKGQPALSKTLCAAPLRGPAGPVPTARERTERQCAREELGARSAHERARCRDRGSRIRKTQCVTADAYLRGGISKSGTVPLCF